MVFPVHTRTRSTRFPSASAPVTIETCSCGRFPERTSSTLSSPSRLRFSFRSSTSEPSTLSPALESAASRVQSGSRRCTKLRTASTRW
eukprot:3375785-Pyramimonas_sp.AAC.1